MSSSDIRRTSMPKTKLKQLLKDALAPKRSNLHHILVIKKTEQSGREPSTADKGSANMKFKHGNDVPISISITDQKFDDPRDTDSTNRKTVMSFSVNLSANRKSEELGKFGRLRETSQLTKNCSR